MICLKTEIELSRVILNGTTNRFLRHFSYTYIWLRGTVKRSLSSKGYNSHTDIAKGITNTYGLLFCQGFQSFAGPFGPTGSLNQI